MTLLRRPDACAEQPETRFYDDRPNFRWTFQRFCV